LLLLRMRLAEFAAAGEFGLASWIIGPGIPKF